VFSVSNQLCLQWPPSKSRRSISRERAASVGRFDPGLFDSVPVLFRQMLNHTEDLVALFARLQELCGFELTEKAQGELIKKGAAFELVYPDIRKVSARVRNMNVILLAEASTLHLQSVKQLKLQNVRLASEGEESGETNVPHFKKADDKAERLFQLAMRKYEKAIEATPDNVEIMKKYGDALVMQAQLNGPTLGSYTMCQTALKMYSLAMGDGITSWEYYSGNNRDETLLNPDDPVAEDPYQGETEKPTRLLHSDPRSDRSRVQLPGLLLLMNWVERVVNETDFCNRSTRMKFIDLLCTTYAIATKTLKHDENEHTFWRKWALLLLEKAQRHKKRSDFLHERNHESKITSLYSDSGRYFRKAIMLARSEKWKRLGRAADGSPTRVRKKHASFIRELDRFYQPVMEWLENGLILEDRDLAIIMHIKQHSPGLTEINSDWCSCPLSNRALLVMLRLVPVKALILTNCEGLTDVPFSSTPRMEPMSLPETKARSYEDGLTKAGIRKDVVTIQEEKAADGPEEQPRKMSQSLPTPLPIAGQSSSSGSVTIASTHPHPPSETPPREVRESLRLQQLRKKQARRSRSYNDLTAFTARLQAKEVTTYINPLLKVKPTPTIPKLNLTGEISPPPTPGSSTSTVAGTVAVTVGPNVSGSTSPTNSPPDSAAPIKQSPRLERNSPASVSMPSVPSSERLGSPSSSPPRPVPLLQQSDSTVVTSTSISPRSRAPAVMVIHRKRSLTIGENRGPTSPRSIPAPHHHASSSESSPGSSSSSMTALVTPLDIPPPIIPSTSYEFRYDDVNGMPLSVQSLSTLKIDNCTKISDRVLRKWIEATNGLSCLYLSKTNIFAEPTITGVPPYPPHQQPTSPVRSRARTFFPSTSPPANNNPLSVSPPGPFSSSPGSLIVRPTGQSMPTSPVAVTTAALSHSATSSATSRRLGPLLSPRARSPTAVPASTSMIKALTFSPNFCALTELNLSYCQTIGDENKLLFVQLGKKLTFLKSLDLSWSRITDANLKHLLNASYTAIILETGRVKSRGKKNKKPASGFGSDGDLDTIMEDQLDPDDDKPKRAKRRRNRSVNESRPRELPGLTNLNLTRCVRLTEATVRSISKRAPNLQTLLLSGTDCVTDRSLVWLASSLQHLTKLDLSNCHELSSVAPLVIYDGRSCAEADLSSSNEIDISNVKLRKRDKVKKKVLKKSSKQSSPVSKKKEKEKNKKDEKDKEKEKDKDKKDKDQEKESKKDKRKELAPRRDSRDRIERRLDRDSNSKPKGKLSSSSSKEIITRVEERNQDDDEDVVKTGCPALVELNLNACNKLIGKGSEIAKVARGRSQLQSISLYQTQATDEVVSKFAKHSPGLKHIRLSHCEDICTSHYLNYVHRRIIPLKIHG
jgi:hypothetical protein